MAGRGASPREPAWFVGDGRGRDGGRVGVGVAAVAMGTPAQRGAIGAARRRRLGGGRVGHAPQAEHGGGGLIVVELFGRRLGEGGIGVMEAVLEKR